MPRNRTRGDVILALGRGPAFVALATLAVATCIDHPRSYCDEKPVSGESTPEIAESAAIDGEGPEFRTERLRGKVVWLADALKDEFDISTVPEAADRSLVIRTEQGELVPLVENLRGRAFRMDKRLRGKQMEILVRRYTNQPFVQVLRLFQLEGEKRYELDYWCDICAIVMYETGPCACCQEDNRLRRRLVEE